MKSKTYGYEFGLKDFMVALKMLLICLFQQQIIPHPEYSLRTKKNDIALIRLTDRLWITEFIQPVCLQTNSRDEDPHLNLIVTGWRQTTNGN